MYTHVCYTLLCSIRVWNFQPDKYPAAENTHSDDWTLFLTVCIHCTYMYVHVLVHDNYCTITMNYIVTITPSVTYCMHTHISFVKTLSQETIIICVVSPRLGNRICSITYHCQPFWHKKTFHVHMNIPTMIYCCVLWFLAYTCASIWNLQIRPYIYWM